MVEESKDKDIQVDEGNKLKNIMSMDIKDVILKKKKKKKKQLNKDVLSIDIDETFMNISVGRYFKNDLTVKMCIQEKTPDNCYEDGKIINEEFLYEEIKKIIKENKIRAKYISFTSNSSLIINRDILIPKVEEDELKTVIRYEIEQYLPINLNDYIIQFLILDHVNIDNTEKIKVHVICYPEKIARSYHDLIKKLKLKPLSLDVTFNSLSKIINYSQEINNKDYNIEGINGFIDIGEKSTEINIFSEGNLSFTRIVKMGYKDIIKENINDFEIDYFTSEIERVLQFYRNKTHGKNVDDIYIIGEGSNYKEILRNMKDKINSNINPIKQLGYIEFKNEEKNVYKFIKSIGTIIRL